MSKYENMDLWEIFINLYEKNCEEIDPYLAKKLNIADDIFSYYYHFSFLYIADKMPLTVNKISKVLRDAIDKSEIEWERLRIIGHWADSDLAKTVLNHWMDDKEESLSVPRWIFKHIIDDRLHISILKKLIKLYRKKKSRNIVEDIYNIFQKVDAENLPEACELIVKSTPAVVVLLLNKENIPEKYIIEGLKALSKLNKQRNIKTKIDFKTLEHLGPKSRLDAMKQLMGIMSNWYRLKQTELPFKEIPTKESIEKFLFPCSFKYNEEVSKLLKRFDEMTNPFNQKKIEFL
jgi:hypothetical protein